MAAGSFGDRSEREEDRCEEDLSDPILLELLLQFDEDDEAMPEL
ncbi:MAG: hypothetical protein WA609_00815 [Terriglobales bacterium]